MARTESQKAANAAYMRKYRKKNRDEINRKQREVYAENPEPAKARGAEWRADNPEKVKAQAVRAGEQYQNDPVYREHRLELCKNWREANPEKVAVTQANKWKNNREHLQAYRRKWAEENAEELTATKLEWEHQDRLKNPGKWRAKYAAYRAMKIQRTPPWADMETIQYIYENCPEGDEVDHIIPLQGEYISGLHVPENLQFLTILENRVKGNSWDDDE